MNSFSEENIKFVIGTFIFVTPLTWGVYEFRKFRLRLEDMYKSIHELNGKIEDISKNNLEKYPFFKQTKDLIDKVNNVFRPLS
tara:strand:+ start:219 stop:467 length:249 start_codon:yes stop_codon:yes gene_type:complete